jgi:pimeloyl-ACP methyl ester carboxylesterase
MSAVTDTAPPAAAPRAETVVVAGLPVHVLTAGTGAPLVYLHGAGDLGGWPPALDLLAADFRVVRPDHPGFNQSGDDPAIGSVAALSERYLEVFDALGLAEFDLIGTSLGGWLAAEIALRSPNRIRRLVLVDAAGLAPGSSSPNMFDVPADELVALTCGDAASLAAGRQRDAAVRADAVLSERRTRNTATTARIAGDPYMHDPALPARLAGLRLPTLVVWGELDGLFPVETATSWTDLLPVARAHVVAGAGHLPLVDRPAEFARVVAEFLSVDAPDDSPTGPGSAAGRVRR